VVLPGPAIQGRVERGQVSILTLNAVSSSSDDELFKLLGTELQHRISTKHGSPEFVAEIQRLPIGLRAMAATYELDVSLALDDLGWHFGNWHDEELAEETARGLEVLGASELARIFREALRFALQYWSELGAEGGAQWYHGSPLETAVDPLNKQAWQFLDKHKNGIFHYWVDYARKHPDGVGAAGV
jgi:hypothetical protein